MESKSKILVVGATGYIGRHIVHASVAAGHPTFAMVRDTTSNDPAKAQLIESFKSKGVTLLQGSVDDYGSIKDAVTQVDVVISAIGIPQLAKQVKIIQAIKEAGSHIKRFLPSEFGHDRVPDLSPLKALKESKVEVRRVVEAEGIPYTYINSNFFAGYSLPSLCQYGKTAPPRDRVTILGNGDVRAVFVREEDIGEYTIRAVDDPRTLNKSVYMRPPGNIYSMNDLVALWEKKIGKTLERTYLSEEQLLQQIQETEFPTNLMLSIMYSVFVRGDHTNFEIEESFGVEASKLYPDIKYITVDEYLDQFI